MQKQDQVAAALLATLTSPNVSGLNYEAANVVDVLNFLAWAAGRIAKAITPDAAPGQDCHGGYVASLTEAVVGMTRSLENIAIAIHDMADAVDGLREPKGN